MKQVALVTGASRGIGLSVARALAKQGFAVAINGPFDDDELSRALGILQADGAVAMKIAFDVSDLKAHDVALRSISRTLGPLSTLVNNAGVGVMKRGDPLDVSEESWDRCLSVNTRGMFFLTQAFVKHVLAKPRESERFYSIVNITSSNAVAVAELRAEYAASKAAAAMVSKTWAVRLGREGIAVYDVQPGLIETDMTAAVIAQYKRRAKDGLTLLPRVGQPSDIGDIVAALASNKLPYTTGQVISADGGLLVPRF